MAYVAMILFVVIILFVAGRSPLKRPRPIPTISNPVLGVLNLIGPAAETDVTSDLEQLTQYSAKSDKQMMYRLAVTCCFCTATSTPLVW